MKFLVLAVIVAAILWWLRSQRRPHLPPTPGPSQPHDKREDMVACAVCGVHLPRSEALPGRGGLFCGEPHRRSFEQGAPPP